MHSFTLDSKFCLRGQETQLFIPTQLPLKGVARATISRCVKGVMDKAGLCVKCFKLNSTRATASSYAKANGAPFEFDYKISRTDAK